MMAFCLKFSSVKRTKELPGTPQRYTRHKTFGILHSIFYNQKVIVASQQLSTGHYLGEQMGEANTSFHVH